MNSLLFAPPQASSVSLWRDCIAPKEHGSWSLAFEPIALSLIVAPSVPGALLGVAFAAGFFARRPVRIGWGDARRDRRRAARAAFLFCIAAGALGIVGAVGLAGWAWTLWLAPVALAGMVFVYHDTQGAGREETAEIAGSAAFALAPAAFAILAGWQPLNAGSLALLMVARSVPSVIFVRAFVRASKTGFRRDLPALLAASVALAGAVILHHRGIAPLLAVIATGIFLLRALVLLVALRPAWRARRIGMIEAVLGLCYVVGLGVAWNN